jgi:broad specificity phosphatase PhoE
VWYASNLLRARKTAEHLARAGADMDRLHIDPDLAEQHFGSWQGLTYVEIAEKHANNHLFWLGPPEHRPPGGESFVDLRDRTVKSIDRLTAEHRGRDIVATAHGGTIRARSPTFNLHEAAVRFGSTTSRSPDRAFRAGRSRPCLEGGLRRHAARAGRGQGAALA